MHLSEVSHQYIGYTNSQSTETKALTMARSQRDYIKHLIALEEQRFKLDRGHFCDTDCYEYYNYINNGSRKCQVKCL